MSDTGSGIGYPCPACGDIGVPQYNGEVSWCENRLCRVRGYEKELRLVVVPR